MRMTRHQCKKCGYSHYQINSDVDLCPRCEPVVWYGATMETRQVTSQQTPSVGRETKHRHPITGE